MKPSVNTLESLADIDRVETTGHVRRIGAQMLLALARKEIASSDVEAAAKMIAAQAMHMQTEVKLAVAAIQLREKGAQLGEVVRLGQQIIGEGQTNG